MRCTLTSPSQYPILYKINNNTPCSPCSPSNAFPYAVRPLLSPTSPFPYTASFPFLTLPSHQPTPVSALSAETEITNVMDSPNQQKISNSISPRTAKSSLLLSSMFFARVSYFIIPSLSPVFDTLIERSELIAASPSGYLYALRSRR